MFVNGSWPTSTSRARRLDLLHTVDLAVNLLRHQAHTADFFGVSTLESASPATSTSSRRCGMHLDAAATQRHHVRVRHRRLRPWVITQESPGLTLVRVGLRRQRRRRCWFRVRDEQPGKSIYKTTDPLGYVHTARCHCGGSSQHRSRTTPTATLMSLLLQLTPSTFKGSTRRRARPGHWALVLRRRHASSCAPQGVTAHQSSLTSSLLYPSRVFIAAYIDVSSARRLESLHVRRASRLGFVQHHWPPVPYQRPFWRLELAMSTSATTTPQAKC
jgi:hypothetical protein